MARIQDPTPALQVVQTFFETSTASAAAMAARADAPPSQVAATAPQDETRAETMIPVTEGVGILLPYWLFFFLLGFALISLTGLFVVSRYYRSRLGVGPEPATYSAPGFNAADWHPDVRPHIEKELAEIRSNYERLQKTYSVLLTRHKTLIREVQRHQHQNGTRRPAQETTATPRRTQDPSNVSR